MTLHGWTVTVTVAVAAGLGLGGAALAQAPAQAVNPAGAGAPGQAVNPTSMPPGSQAGTAPGMNPGPQAPAGAPRVAQGTAPDARPGDGGTGGGRSTIETGRTTRGAGAGGETLASGLETGANSFTADQAAERMAQAGFNDVQDLRLDERGIWHGRAIREGVPTGVAMDFRGNVVAVR
jgi:hypothetical protein